MIYFSLSIILTLRREENKRKQSRSQTRQKSAYNCQRGLGTFFGYGPVRRVANCYELKREYDSSLKKLFRLLMRMTSRWLRPELGLNT